MNRGSAVFPRPNFYFMPVRSGVNMEGVPLFLPFYLAPGLPYRGSVFRAGEKDTAFRRRPHQKAGGEASPQRPGIPLSSSSSITSTTLV